MMAIRLFHNFNLNSTNWTTNTKLDFSTNWTQIAGLTVRHFNHYTRMFPVLVWGCYFELNAIHAWMILSNSYNSSNWTKFPSFQKKTRLLCVSQPNEIASVLFTTLEFVCQYTKMAIFTDCIRSIGEGYVFTRVCHSVHREVYPLRRQTSHRRQTPLLPQIHQDMVNRRSVRILLECILVSTSCLQ